MAERTVHINLVNSRQMDIDLDRADRIDPSCSTCHFVGVIDGVAYDEILTKNPAAASVAFDVGGMRFTFYDTRSKLNVFNPNDYVGENIALTYEGFPQILGIKSDKTLVDMGVIAVHVTLSNLTVAANTDEQFTIDVPVPTGYRTFAVMDLDAHPCLLGGWHIRGNKIDVPVRNVHSYAETGYSIGCTALCIREELYNYIYGG